MAGRSEGDGNVRIGRVVLLGLIFLVLANLWVRQGALLTLAAQVAMAVPPVPALATLLVLLAGLGLVRKFGVRRKEILGVYAFLTLAVALTSGAAMRFFLPALTVPYYFSSTENQWEKFFKYIPDWAVPHGDELIRQYFEGAEAGGVPWEAWAQPLAIWLLFFVAFYGLLMCLALVFRPVWEEGEHLSFPMAELPLMLAGYRQEITRGIWTNAIFWSGFLLVGLYHLFNIFNAFNPSIPALGLNTNLSPLFNQHPLSALQPINIQYRPEIFGIAYMMPSDIVLSTLLLYFLYFKGSALGGAIIGVDISGYPFQFQQAMGGYVALAAVIIYAARGRIANVFGTLVKRNEVSRLLPVGLVVTLAGVIVFWLIFGMKLWVLAAYLVLLLSVGIGYMRIRAETGYPTWWIKPLNMERDMLVSLFGTRRMAPGGDFSTLTGLSFQNFMYRGYFVQLVAYQIEALRIGGQIKVTRRKIVTLLILAVVLGSMVSWWMHLSTAYQFGSNVLEGGTTQGGSRVRLMTQAYDSLASWMRGHAEPNRNHTIAFVVGIGMVLVLAVLRRIFLQFPLHPSGFVLAMTGGGIIGWSMLLLSYIIRSVVLRLGGMRLYNRLLPFFIGVVVGHYFWAGTVWALIASFGGQGFDRYPVWF